jgi:DNA-binding protein HU-beta
MAKAHFVAFIFAIEKSERCPVARAFEGASDLTFVPLLIYNTATIRATTQRGFAMNKAELIETVAQKTGLPKRTAREAVNTIFSTISKSLADGQTVRITGFGSFAARPRRSSSRINPQTGQRLLVPSKVVPAFRAGRELKEMVRKRLKVVEAGDKLTVKKA